MQRGKRAVIIGGGPAGLTAAWELVQRSEIEPVVLERCDILGGIARTVNYKGNRIDIGGHRFFSKSDRVMDWWLNILPLEEGASAETEITYQQKTRTIGSPGAPAAERSSPDRVDNVMLVRERQSRIYYLRKFFTYPISLSVETLGNLGLLRSFRIGMSYLRALAFPIRDESNLEQFFVNRFGRELYLTFFKDYTEKVWGTPCDEISAEWGAQRIKGLSITRAVMHFLKGLLPKRESDGTDIAQKGSETSLIERFLYPKFGPGQMWEEVARQVQAGGGTVEHHRTVTKLYVEENRIVAVDAVDERTGEVHHYEGDWFFSTMPMRELIQSLDCEVPASVREVSEGLVYRDFITVGLLVDDLEIRESGKNGGGRVKDNWIYIQEPDVKVGRLQIFNNWSPYMVSDPTKSWVGLEYFCNEGDELWELSDEELKTLASEELERIEIIDGSKVRDAVVIRMPKTYPAYFGTYPRFDELRAWVDDIENLFLVGRNGMHKYNNQDHSMLTAIMAVENILEGRTDKSNLWQVNTEEEYHEEKSA